MPSYESVTEEEYCETTDRIRSEIKSIERVLVENGVDLDELRKEGSEQWRVDLKSEYDKLLSSFEKSIEWRNAWNGLMNNFNVMKAKYPLQKQMDYIEGRANTANIQAGKYLDQMKKIQRSLDK